MHWLFLIAPVCLDFSEGKAVTLNSGSCINNRLINQKQKSFNHANPITIPENITKKRHCLRYCSLPAFFIIVKASRGTNRLRSQNFSQVSIKASNMTPNTILRAGQTQNLTPFLALAPPALPSSGCSDFESNQDS
jgi:hypothetical protein